MIKYFCDRCGKEIDNVTAYTVEFEPNYDAIEDGMGKDIISALDSLNYTEPKVICADCKKEIENFINGEKKDED